MGDEEKVGVIVTEDVKKKISEGMKRSHARRRKQKKVTAAVPKKTARLESVALRQLIKERDGLNVAITILQRRGL